MKMKFAAVAIMGFTMSTAIAATDSISLKTDLDKISYSIGSDLGSNFKRQGIEVDAHAMAAGIKDSMSGGKLLLTEEQMKNILDNFQKELLAKRASDFNKQAETNKTKGESFLKENKAKEDVVTLPSGLQYKIIKKGSGEKPVKEDTVTVEYTGRLIDGEVFDSTEKNGGKPATFKLTQVIPGWTEALQLMPVGSTWEIYVPSNLAYGERSVGGPIGPNETLIFNVHLISLKKDKAQEKAKS